MGKCMYAVISRESGIEISYHETMTEVLKTIEMYEQMDELDGVYTPDYYDWKMMDEQGRDSIAYLPRIDNFGIINSNTMKSLTYKIYPPIGKPFCLTNYKGYTVRVDTGSRQKESRLHFLLTMMNLRRGKYKIDIERLG